MLLFICFFDFINCKDCHFNTSHVTVYQGTDGGLRLNEPHFNTSHVTVYPSRFSSSHSDNSYFNTSHVTVYLRQVCPACLLLLISIHLMLLFIQSTACRRIEKRVFQYISCYCLSYLSASDIHWLVISIHLMLLFIICRTTRKK